MKGRKFRYPVFGNKHPFCTYMIEKFKNAVLHHNKIDLPVYLNFGFGRKPLPEFLNIDISLNVEEQYNIFVFDWLRQPLPIPDNSVDFVFSEDFFEHLIQREQIIFLYEMYRVLKPGCFNRVSTPNLCEILALNNKVEHRVEAFPFPLVHDDWDLWHHRSIVTSGYLKEIATIIGYSEVHFNGKNKSISGVNFEETRPDYDRDQLTGNIHADLKK